MSSKWKAVRGHLRDGNPVNETDFADAWRDPVGQALLARLREEASATPSIREPELAVGSFGSARRPSTRALASTALAVAVLLIVLVTVLVFHKRNSGPAIAAAPSPTASTPTIRTAPAVVSPISQPSAAVCGYRHAQDGFRLDVATAPAIKASNPKIDGAGALQLARADHGGEQLSASPVSIFVTPVLLTQTQPGVRWLGYTAALVGRLMYDVNVTGMHNLVSGKIGGSPIVADSAEILIDAVTGKEAITLECSRSAPPAAPHYLGPVTSASLAAGNALELSPPGDARPKLGWAEAYASMCKLGAGCDLAGSASVVLAFVTTPGQANIRPDGSIIPTIQHELSYVVTWTDLVDCPPLGGAIVAKPTPTPEPTTTPKARTCVDTRVVDANTGNPIAGEYIDG